MTLINNLYNYEAINRETIDGKRHYCLPDGSKVPSVTTILDRTKSKESRDALDKWRKAVGVERAQQHTTGRRFILAANVFRSVQRRFAGAIKNYGADTIG